MPRLLILSVSLFLAGVLTAEEQPVLRWADLERLIEEHPGLKLARAGEERARGELGIARQYPNPEVGVGYGRGRAKDGSDQGPIRGLELTIPLEWPGRLYFRINSAQAGLEAAGMEREAAIREVRKEIRSLFVKLAYSESHLSVVTSAVDDLNRLAEIARRRVEKGEARPAELSRVQSEWGEGRIELDRAEAETVLFRRNLNLWLGNKLPPRFSIDLNLEDLPPLPSFNQAEAALRSSHPSILAAEARRRMARSALDAERHALVPDLSVGGFYDQDLDAVNYGGKLTFSVPLWNWNRGGRLKARADAMAAESEADLQERQLLSSLYENHSAATAALVGINRYRENIIPGYQKNAEAQERMYRIGETGLLEMLDSRRGLFRARREYLATLLAYQLATLEVYTLAGGLTNE